MLAFAVTSASAQQVYKCKSEASTVYSDTPCATGTKQVMTQIRAGGQDTDSSASASMLNQRLDDAVKLAIANDDLQRAEALATTPEQKAWVSAARKETAKSRQGRTEADLAAEKSTSAECLEARRNLESAAASDASDSVISARTNLMNSACGSNNQTTSVVYGGGSSRYLFYPYPHLNQPWHGKPGHTSPPYDRARESPFGSRFIRPGDAPR